MEDLSDLAMYWDLNIASPNIAILCSPTFFYLKLSEIVYFTVLLVIVNLEVALLLSQKGVKCWKCVRKQFGSQPRICLVRKRIQN